MPRQRQVDEQEEHPPTTGAGLADPVHRRRLVALDGDRLAERRFGAGDLHGQRHGRHRGQSRRRGRAGRRLRRLAERHGHTPGHGRPELDEHAEHRFLGRDRPGFEQEPRRRPDSAEERPVRRNHPGPERSRQPLVPHAARQRTEREHRRRALPSEPPGTRSRRQRLDGEHPRPERTGQPRESQSHRKPVEREHPRPEQARRPPNTRALRQRLDGEHPGPEQARRPPNTRARRQRTDRKHPGPEQAHQPQDAQALRQRTDGEHPGPEQAHQPQDTLAASQQPDRGDTRPERAREPPVTGALRQRTDGEHPGPEQAHQPQDALAASQQPDRGDTRPERAREPPVSRPRLEPPHRRCLAPVGRLDRPSRAFPVRERPGRLGDPADGAGDAEDGESADRVLLPSPRGRRRSGRDVPELRRGALDLAGARGRKSDSELSDRERHGHERRLRRRDGQRDGSGDRRREDGGNGRDPRGRLHRRPRRGRRGVHRTRRGPAGSGRSGPALDRRRHDSRHSAAATGSRPAAATGPRPATGTARVRVAGRPVLARHGRLRGQAVRRAIRGTPASMRRRFVLEQGVRRRRRPDRARRPPVHVHRSRRAASLGRVGDRGHRRWRLVLDQRRQERGAGPFGLRIVAESRVETAGPRRDHGIPPGRPPFRVDRCGTPSRHPDDPRSDRIHGDRPAPHRHERGGANTSRPTGRVTAESLAGRWTGTRPRSV